MARRRRQLLALSLVTLLAAAAGADVVRVGQVFTSAVQVLATLTVTGATTFSSTFLSTGTSTFGSAAGAANSVALNATAGCLTYEGSSVDANEATVCATDPAADNTFNFPAYAAGTYTIAVQGQSQSTLTKALTESSATAVVNVSVADNSGTGGLFDYCIFASDGTSHNQRCSSIKFSAVNEAGTEVCNVGSVTNETNDGNVHAVSGAGTLTYAVACNTTPTNGIQFTFNAVSSLTQTILRADYKVSCNNACTVTPQ